MEKVIYFLILPNIQRVRRLCKTSDAREDEYKEKF